MNKNSSQILSLVMFGFALYFVIMMCSNKSYYRLSPTHIETTGSPKGSFHDLPYNLECVPGPTDKGSYYTRSLTPGGYCGDQQFVHDTMNYEISNGIGGSLI